MTTATYNPINVKLPKEVLGLILGSLTASLSAIHDRHRMMKVPNGEAIEYLRLINQSIEHIRGVMHLHLTYHRASLLASTSDFEVLEHPDFGDEASIMLFDKATGAFFEETPFYDIAEVREVMDWLRKQREVEVKV